MVVLIAQYKYTQYLRTVHSRMVKTVNFMLCVFYHKINGKRFIREKKTEKNVGEERRDREVDS